MLSYEFMGLLALWILWINTALIAAAALIDIARLGRPLGGFRRLRAGESGLGYRAVRVESVGPEAPAFARLSVTRTGRLADAPSLDIQFGAQRPESRMFGGIAKEGDLAIAVAASPAARVWLEPEAIDRALSRFEEHELATAEEQARRRRGFQKTTELDVFAGQTVYIGGRFEPTPDGLALSGTEAEPVLVSTIDPARFVRAQRAKTFAFLLGTVALLGVISGLALSEPRFGPLSKLGGVLGLAYFLLVLPAATWLRERTRAPDLKTYFGHWRVPGRAIVSPSAGAESA